MKEKYLDIYDFSLFPYALGDVITFILKTKIEIIKNKYEKGEIIICADRENFVNFNQKKIITEKNYQKIYNDLRPAFNLLDDKFVIKYFNEHEELIKYLKKYNNKNIKIYFKYLKHNKLNLFDKILKYLEKEKIIKKIPFFIKIIPYFILKNFSNENKVNKFFIKKINSHEVINKFYYKYKYIPELKINEKYISEVESYLKNRKKKYLTIHIRNRMRESIITGIDSLYRDSDENEWIKFIEYLYEEKKEYQIILLGRIEEKAQKLMLPNVISLQKEGFTVGHDLAAIEISKAFMGSSSGFAAYANFSSKPYVITNVNKNACRAYCINYGENSLPFAKKNQILLYGKENVNILINNFELITKN